MNANALAAAVLAAGFLATVLADTCTLAFLAIVLDSPVIADAAALAVLAAVLVAAVSAHAYTAAVLAQRLASVVGALAAHSGWLADWGRDLATLHSHVHWGKTVGTCDIFDLGALGSHSESIATVFHGLIVRADP